MFEDKDIKIAGDKPSLNISKVDYPQSSEEFQIDRANGNIEKAKRLGTEIAEIFVKQCKKNDNLIDANEDSSSLSSQRILLLSFAATVGFECFCPGSVTANIAQNNFYDKLQQLDAGIYADSCDPGALSFYFLAFRSGNDNERRIGQTFAMVCGHDGDPIYQELGEALYCWFISQVEEKANKLKFEYRS